jgi:choline dehydrogenase
MAERSFDFIICGGGSAASVAAMRLVREFGFSVLLLERGPATTNRIMAMPAGYMKFLARDDFLEMHKTVPQPQLGGRAPIVPVGKALGGGSAVNAMVYMRGQAEDYDGWAAGLGTSGEWSYRDMLPHFTGIEANSRFNDQYHGIGGNLRVSDPGQLSETTEDFLLAAQGLGHTYNPDFNGARQNGVGIMQHTYGQWGRYKERSDAKKAFLDPLAEDKRLTIITGARVDRIVVENGRAVGLVYEKDSATHTVRAEREVLVAAGTYNSRQADDAERHRTGGASATISMAFAVVADLAGVGRTCMDHHEVPVIATTKQQIGLFRPGQGLAMVRNGLQYLLFNSGPGDDDRHRGLPVLRSRWRRAADHPALLRADRLSQDRDVSESGADLGRHLHLVPAAAKGARHGAFALGDPEDQPLVDCNFFGDPDDLRLTVALDAPRAPQAARDRAVQKQNCRRTVAGCCRDERSGGAGALLRADGQDQLPPGGHAAHGARQRSERGSGTGP